MLKVKKKIYMRKYQETKQTKVSY